MQYSLNQTMAKLEKFQTDHLQLKSFRSTNPLDLLDAPETSFPAMAAMINPSRIQGKEVFLDVSLFFMDLVHADQSNQLEVSSDMLLVALDARAYLNDPSFDDLFYLDDNLPIEPFYEQGTNMVSGWKMDLTIKIIDLMDRCQIPQ